MFLTYTYNQSRIETEPRRHFWLGHTPGPLFESLAFECAKQRPEPARK